MSNSEKPTDNPVDENALFISMADAFIDLANQHCEQTKNALVNAAMLYGTARFCAFVTASMAQSKDTYETNIDNAVDYYTEEFQKMLREHMEQYKSVFQETPRYEHLMNKK